MKTYSIAAPYRINGHLNVHGLAIAAEMEKNIMNWGISTDRDAVERELHTVSCDDIALYDLYIEEHEFELEE